MLMRTDPFQALEQWSQQLLGQQGLWGRPTVGAMDAYRQGEQFVVQFDLPGVDPASIDVGVEHNALTVQAERKPTTGEGLEPLVTERSTGMFSRHLFLGETLDTEHIDASYDAGVLTLRIPVAEHAKPRPDQRGQRAQADHRMIRGQRPGGPSPLGVGQRLPGPTETPEQQTPRWPRPSGGKVRKGFLDNLSNP